MHWKNWLKLIGIVLLLWLLSTVDLGEAVQALIELNPAYVLGYVVCFVAMMLVRTIRLSLALSRLEYHLSFGDCLVATLEPTFMGLVSPGRLGEFTRVGYIHAHGISMAEAIAVVTVERLIDMCILLVFGAGGIVYIFAHESYHLAAGVVIAAGLLLSFGSICGYNYLFQFLKKHLNWLSRWEPSAWTFQRHLITTSFLLVMRRAALSIFWLGLAGIALNFLQVFFLAKAFAFKADYLVVIFAYAAATLVSLLPISVGGLGTREATYVMIMGREGILKEKALLFSLLDGIVLAIFGLFLLIIPIWIIKGRKKVS